MQISEVIQFPLLSEQVVQFFQHGTKQSYVSVMHIKTSIWKEGISHAWL